MDELNKATTTFLQKLTKDESVLGVALFGSWARGNQREDSDVDLLVIVKQGYKRSIEYVESQAFEIIYTSVEGAKKYYKTDLDATHRFWAHAKILMDRDNSIQPLKEFAIDLTKNGKAVLSEDDLKYFEFDALDQIRFATAAHSNGDIATANLVLHIKVAALAEIYFDTIQEWRPAPKQILAEIQNRNEKLGNLLANFYSDEIHFSNQAELTEKIIGVIFQKD